MRFLVLLAAATPTILFAADPTVDVPSCAHPAKVEAHKGPIPGDYVFLKHGSDLKPSALTERYGLTVTGIVLRNGLQGLAVPSLSAADIAKLRCDPDVELITTASGS
jgi:hypothetical protein